ncbi:MAG: hypothetical protein P4N59_05340 [Negativicutes bacterium]|nr:hypothetical protein [Negativicutes bacterium]
MKTHTWTVLLILALSLGETLKAQDSSGLDLSTRSAGTTPSHLTINSAAQWMQNPLDQKLMIGVTNLYAEASDFMEVDIAGNQLKFYGAGRDVDGNLIPTNYPPVTVGVLLRRAYNLNVTCPNSGPNGSPMFTLNDFSDPDTFIEEFFNGSSPAPAVSAFLWKNFTAGAQYIFTNGYPNLDASKDSLRQTNLVLEMNRIISTISFYTNSAFGSYTNEDPLPSLIALNPTGDQMAYVNRLLLYDSIQLSDGLNGDSLSGTAGLTFSVQIPPQLKISKFIPLPSYDVILNGTGGNQVTLNLSNPNAGYCSTNASVVEVVKEKYAQISFGDGCDDATKAPGQGSWLRLGPGCTQDTNRISLEWHVSLGRSFDGLAAGQLSLEQLGLSSDTYTPASIYYDGQQTNLVATETMYSTNLPYLITNSDGTITTNAFVPVAAQNIWSITNSGVAATYTNCLVPVVLLLNNMPYLVTNSAGVFTNYTAVIRQVSAYQTFIDILTPNTNSISLKFYLPSQILPGRDITGLHTNIQGSPYVTWTIQNPNPGTAAGLDIIENRNGNVSTQVLTKATSGGAVTWTLTLGTGTEQRVETRQVSFTGGATPTDRQEIDTVEYEGSTTPAYQCSENYHCFPWGWELTQTSVPDSPAALVTAYSYYTNTDGSDPGDPYSVGYSQPKKITYPDGYWELRKYLVEDPNDVISLYVDCQVIHPYFDGGDANATSVDDINYLGQNQVTYSFDNGKPTTDSSATTTLQSETTQSTSSSQGAGDAMHSWWININDSWDFYPSMPLGEAGHHAYLQTPLQYTVYYYDHGVFSNSMSTFSKDVNNHLYSSPSPANYPDHRETQICGIVYGWSDLIQYSMAWYYPGYIPGYDQPLTSYSESEDHTLSYDHMNVGSGALFFPGGTRKTARIFVTIQVVLT